MAFRASRLSFIHLISTKTNRIMKDTNPNKNFGLDGKPSLRDIGKLSLLVAAAIAGTIFGSLLTKGKKK